MSFKIEINPELKMKSDIMFKAFYGRKENEEFLQDFLEAVLEEKIKIKKVSIDTLSLFTVCVYRFHDLTNLCFTRFTSHL